MALKLSYEPFLVKQFNPAGILNVESGLGTSGGTFQDSMDLWFHLLGLRISNNWALPNIDSLLNIETGISVSPLVVRKECINPAMNSSFTGTYKVCGGGSDYWSGRTIDFVLDNTERYIIEETSLVYVPVTVGISRIFPIGGNLQIQVGANAGVSLFYLSLIRKELDGSPNAYNRETPYFETHFAQTLGILFGLNYELSPRSEAFFDLAWIFAEDYSVRF